MNRYFAYLKRYGFKRLLRKYIEKKHESSYEITSNPSTEKDLQKQKTHSFKYNPLISILVPAFNPEEGAFTNTLISVKNQLYTNWELCISDAGSLKIDYCVKNIFKGDSRIKYIHSNKELGISDNSNEAIKMATGEYIALFDHDDILEPDALYEVVKCINEENPDMIFTDEDKISSDSKKYFDPYRKPDYNLPLLLSNNYICHFTVIKKSIVDKIGGFRKEYDGAQDYDLFLRITDYTSNISHINKILYHWRAGKNSTSDNPFNKEYAFSAGKRALEDYLFRNKKKNCQVTELEDPGYYRIICDKNTDDEKYLYVGKYASDEEISILKAKAEFYDADVIFPKIISKGKYVYNGIAETGNGETMTLVGKPAWYKGRFNLGTSELLVCNRSQSEFLIRKDLTDKLDTLNFSDLKKVYVPLVTVRIRGKKNA